MQHSIFKTAVLVATVVIVGTLFVWPAAYAGEKRLIAQGEGWQVWAEPNPDEWKPAPPADAADELTDAKPKLVMYSAYSGNDMTTTEYDGYLFGGQVVIKAQYALYNGCTWLTWQAKLKGTTPNERKKVVLYF